MRDGRLALTIPGFRELLGRLQLRKGVMWQEYQQGADLSITEDINEAQIATSVISSTEGDLLGPRHVLALDIDVPAYLIPSSTPGHSHLYIDVPGGIDQFHWEELIEALAAARVIEEGYAAASIGRKFTALRLPWVRKEDAPTNVADLERGPKADEAVF